MSKISQRLSDEFGMKYNEKKKCWCSDWSNNQRFVVELYSPKGTHKIMRWGYSLREFYNPEQCLDFQYEIPEYTSDIDYAVDYIKSVVDKNIPLMRKWKEKVKTVDDAIVVMNQRVLGDDILRIPQMHYLRAFLYAKNKDIVESMSALKHYYEDREMPRVIIEILNQLANE